LILQMQEQVISAERVHGFLLIGLPIFSKMEESTLIPNKKEMVNHSCSLSVAITSLNVSTLL
jgi:hypothetical protein